VIIQATDSRRPRVSVIVPAYNSARSIERCLAALARQETSHPFEVLVVDSGDDDTCARAERALPAARILLVTLLVTGVAGALDLNLFASSQFVLGIVIRHRQSPGPESRVVQSLGSSRVLGRAKPVARRESEHGKVGLVVGGSESRRT